MHCARESARDQRRRAHLYERRAVFHKKLVEIEDKIKSIGQDLEDKKTEFDGKLQEKIQAQKAGEGSAAKTADTEVEELKEKIMVAVR